MTSTKHGSGAGRALRRGAPALLAAVIIVGATACSSSSSGSGSTGSAGAASGGASSSSSTAASAAGLSQFLPGKKATGTPVKIGLINDEGSSASGTPSVGDSAEAAAKYANDQLGGIAGHPLQVIRCAETEDTASATACANEMVQDNVAAVVIGSGGMGAVMVPIITKAGIPYAQVTGSAIPEMTTSGAFSWSGGYQATLSAMAMYSKQHGYKKVVAFVIDNPASVAGAKSLGGSLFKADGSTLTVEPVPADVADATSQVTAGLGGGQQAALVIADETTCVPIQKALNVVAPQVTPLIITACLNTASVQALGSALNGTKVFGSSSWQSSDPEARLYRYVMAKYAPSVSAGGYTVVGYQGMLGLVRSTAALKGTPTASSMMAAIKAAENVPLPAGAGIKFTCNGKAIPSLPSICSLGEVITTVHNGVATNPQITG